MTFDLLSTLSSLVFKSPRVYLSAPTGPELVTELDRGESGLVQPAAGLSVVSVGAARQLPSSPDLLTWAQRQVNVSTHTFAYVLYVIEIKPLNVFLFQWRCSSTPAGEPEVPQSADQPDAGGCRRAGQQHRGEFLFLNCNI